VPQFAVVHERRKSDGSVERLKKKANSPRPSFSFAGISPRRSQVLTHYYTP